MHAITIRTLTREFRLAVPDAEAAAALAFIAIEPEISGTAMERVELVVERRHGFYALRLPDGDRAEGSAEHLLGLLHALILADVLRSEAAAPLIHGATVVGPWGRAVLVGDKALGKTTLTLHLAVGGHRVEGDEHLVVGDGHVVARPRTLRVKEGSLALVPSLAAAVRRSPFIRTWHGDPIYAVSPAIVGRPWQIARGRLDALVFLDGNHGGRSVMTPLPPEPAFRLLLAQSLLPQTGKAVAVARLRHLATTCPAYRLQLGDLAGAAWHLERIGGMVEAL